MMESGSCGNAGWAEVAAVPVFPTLPEVSALPLFSALAVFSDFAPGASCPMMTVMPKVTRS